MTVTAEDMPAAGEASVIARTILLHIKQSGDSDRLTRAQMHAKHLPGLMAKYIQFLANKRFKKDDVVMAIRNKQREFRVSHARIAENAAANSLAWDIFAEFMGFEDLTPVYTQSIQNVIQAMDLTARSEQAGSVYVSLISDLISSGNVYLEGFKGYQDTVHLDHAKPIGWISDENVFILGSIAMAEANALRQRVVGSPIKYSQAAIYDQLIAAGQLEPAVGGKPTHVIKVNGASQRVLKFKRGVLEQIETSYASAQHEESEVRLEEDGALLN